MHTKRSGRLISSMRPSNGNPQKNQASAGPAAMPQRVHCEMLEARYLLAAAMHINFQPLKTPAPAGYLKDLGAAYATQADQTFGWNADNARRAAQRDSLAAPDARYDTVNYLVSGKNPRYWEIGVPNGLYSVRIVGGDPARSGQRVTIKAERTTVVDTVTSARRPWAEGTATVRVDDGRLTLHTVRRARISPINFIDITPLRDATEPILATTFDSMRGVFATQDVVSSLDHRDWLRFDNVVFGDGMQSVRVDVALAPSEAAPQASQTRSHPSMIEFRLNRPNGRLIGRIMTQPTGGEEVFYSQHTALRRAKGMHNLYVVFKGSVPAAKIRSIQFSSEPLIRVMPLGDSITEGEGSDATYRYWLWQKLRQAGYNVDFVGLRQGVRPGTGDPPYWDFDQDHQGNWEFDSIDIRANIDEYAALKPDVVLIHIGTNDIINDRPADVTIDNLNAIIDGLRSANPQVRILLAQIIPMTWVDLPVIETLNARIGELAAQKNTDKSPVITVDQFTGFDMFGDTYDGVHPYEWGEQKIADRFYDPLKDVLDDMNEPPAA